MRVVLAATAVLALAACGGGSRKDKAAVQPRAVKTARAAEVQLGTSVVVSGTLGVARSGHRRDQGRGPRCRRSPSTWAAPCARDSSSRRSSPTDYELRVQQAEAALAEARARIGLGTGEDDRVDPQQTGTVRQARRCWTRRGLAGALGADPLQGGADRAGGARRRGGQPTRWRRAATRTRSKRSRAAAPPPSQRRAEAGAGPPAAQRHRRLRARSPAWSSSGARPASGEFLAAGAPRPGHRAASTRCASGPRCRSATRRSVRAGQSVRISVDGVPREYAGRLARLSPTINERNRVLVVEADIPNDGALRAGSFARADDRDRRSPCEAVTVPSSAIVTFAGLQKVITRRRRARRSRRR